MTPIVVTARAAGRAIVDEAKERRSEVIILGATRKRRFTERALGGTIDYVLQHAPCEVLINLVPLEGVYVEDGSREAQAAAEPSHEHVELPPIGGGGGRRRLRPTRARPSARCARSLVSSDRRWQYAATTTTTAARRTTCGRATTGAPVATGALVR